ncbi:MAG: hypothetical protein WC822_03870 [Candidatus Paceibacterota bacterium]|jgi:hypothetical protein
MEEKNKDNPIESKAATLEFKACKKLEFRILNDPEQRKLLAERVMELVDQIYNDNIKNIIYLDKSARPISTLFSDLWRKKYPNKEMPLVNFINIGTETGHLFEKKYNTHPGYIGDEDYDRFLNSLSKEKIFEIFGEDAIKEIINKYSYLKLAKDGSVVQLIEEYTNTGESISLAKKILETAFPKLRFTKSTLQEQNQTRYAGDESLRLFETWADPNDKSYFKGTVYSPPWRHEKSEKDYGITGVVDSKDSSFIAGGYHKMPTEERIKAINRQITEMRYQNNETEIAKLQEIKSIISNPNFKPDVNQLRQEMHMVADEYWKKQEITH